MMLEDKMFFNFLSSSSSGTVGLLGKLLKIYSNFSQHLRVKLEIEVTVTVAASVIP